MTGMTYAKFFPSDWRTGCLILNLEEEGLYVRVCMFMYDTGSALPDDDSKAAHLLHVQVQKYKKVMRSLIAKGKIIRAQGILFNERVQEEIDKYRMQHAARSEAAKKREADRKVYATKAPPPRVPPQVPLGVPPQVPPPGCLGGTPEVRHEVGHPKSLKSLSRGSSVVAEPWHELVNLESRSQNPEESKLASSMTPSGGLAGLNGSADPMLSDIVGWMVGGDRQSAKNWLTSFLSQYNQDIVRESYFAVKTDIAEGKLVSQPLRLWAKIAARIKAEPKRSTTDPHKESTAARFKRYLEDDDKPGDAA